MTDEIVPPENPVAVLDAANQDMQNQLEALPNAQAMSADIVALIKVDCLAQLLLHGAFGHLYELRVAETINNSLKAALEQARTPQLLVPGAPDVSKLDL